MNNMLLTVEMELLKLDKEKEEIGEVALCFDEEGLDFLVNKLLSMKGRHDHEHLKTLEWGGGELTSVKQGGNNYCIVHHLRLVKQ